MKTRKTSNAVLSLLLAVPLTLHLAGCDGDDGGTDGGGGGGGGNPDAGSAATDSGSTGADAGATADTGSAGAPDAGPVPDPTWVPIAAGSYQMGCSPNDNECEPRERPVHTATISAFEMMEMEVTNAQYAKFLNEHGNDCSGMSCYVLGVASHRIQEAGGSWTVPAAWANHPTMAVTFNGAKDYCTWAGGRLPSESEWEYAARAGATTRFSCGDDENCLDAIACWDVADTCPVGSKNANAFGLYDMHSNVWEWVEDCWHETYAGAPAMGEAWVDNADCSIRVLRGGVTSQRNAEKVRVSRRQRFMADVGSDDWGFRCAKD